MNDWEKLLLKAYSCIDYATKTAGTNMEWSFGGGTAMMLEYHHRKSKDIDIFLRDAQHLSLFSPRLSDAAETISTSYDEQSNYIKICSKEGEIDFVVAARISENSVRKIEILGREIFVESPVEVVVKKLLFRAADFQVRDIFDTACILQREPEILFNELDSFKSKLDVLERRVHDMESVYQRKAKEMVIEPSSEFIALLDNGHEMVLRFINDCQQKPERTLS